MSDPDLDTVANAFQDVLAAVHDDVEVETLMTVESRLQRVWAEVNDDVDSIEDMEAIYPDDE